MHSKIFMITGLGAVSGMVSGRKNALYSTLEEFHAHFERIDIICPHISSFREREKVFFNNVHVHIAGYPLFLYPFFFVVKAVSLWRSVQFTCMTVQEFPPFYNGIAARLIRFFTGMPYMLEIHHIPGYPRVSGLKEYIYKFLSRIFLKIDSSGASVVRVVNKRQTAGFLEKVGVSSGKIKYIPSMYIDLEAFKPMMVHKEYDCIFVGRLEKNKGIDLFLDAMKKGDFSALMVGDGALTEFAGRKIKNLGLRVKTIGWAGGQDELAGLINSARVLVVSSYNEGGPRVMLEAMACGVPVVTTNVGLVPDLVTDGQSGRVADWLADDIAGKIKSILGDKEMYERCRNAGLDIAAQFERKKIIEQYADAVKNI